jgi:CheY-like chemotaxis protein
MCRILLVENDIGWLELICRALPEYEVAQAQSYDEALALLAAGVDYDVAIVDLNLLEDGNDHLGGEILEIMKDRYTSTRRIALTGEHQTAVRGLLERYGADDLLLKKDGLLLKDRINLAVVREAVKLALRRRVVDDVPRDLRAQQAMIRNSMVAWLLKARQRMDRRARTLQNDVENAERVGKRAEDSASELEVLRASRDDLEVRCAAFLGLVAGIDSDRELADAQREFENLKTLFPA